MSRRDYIVSQAAELVRYRGYENTSLNDILEAAQISKGQFYHYFSTKHELGLVVIDYLFDGWNKRLLENILGKKTDPEARLNEMLQWIVAQHTQSQAKYGCPFGNLAIEMSLHDEEFRQKLQSIFDLWTAKIRQLLRTF
jgi:TetR/AcrR family transcriptional repressor of nem operon